MISLRGLKVQEYECGKRLVTREAWFRAKIVFARENVVPVGPEGPGQGLAVGRFSTVMTMAIS